MIEKLLGLGDRGTEPGWVGGPFGEPGQRSVECAQARVRLANRLLAQKDSLVRVLVDAYGEEIPSYRQMTPSDVAEVARSTEATAVMLIEVAVGGSTAMGSDALERFRHWGRALAARGFPLHAVMRAYQVGLRVGWQFLLSELPAVAPDPDVAAAVIDVASHALLDATGSVARAVTEAFFETERNVATAAERSRRSCFEQLCTGRALHGLAERAEASGIRVGTFHAVLVVVPEEMPGQPAELDGTTMGRLTEALEQVHLGAMGRPPAFDLSRREMRVLWSSASEPRGDLADQVRRVLAGVRVDRALSVGVGRVEPGISGIAVSHGQARRALRAIAPFPQSCQVCSYDDSLPEQAVMADETLRDDAQRLALGPLLSEDAQARGPLLEAVQTYLECHRSIALAARRLGVHRHTVAVRLQRAEALTGHRLDDKHGTLLLQLALLGHKLQPRQRCPVSNEERVEP